MVAVLEELKEEQERTFHLKKLSNQTHFLPSFDYLCLSGFNKMMNLKKEVASTEDYKKLFEFCSSSELLRSNSSIHVHTIFNSEEETEDLFIKKRECILEVLIKMFTQHIISVREIQAFRRQLLEYRKEAESNPEDALKKTRQFILEHLNKMKELPICDTLNQALSLLPKGDSDKCILKFSEIAIKASELINKYINDQTEQYFLKHR